MARRSLALRDWDAFEREQLEAEEDVKAKQQAYRQRADVKAKQQAYQQRADVKAKQQAYQQAYRQRADVKAKQQAAREEDKRLIALARRLGLDASGDIQKVG